MSAVAFKVFYVQKLEAPNVSEKAGVENLSLLNIKLEMVSKLQQSSRGRHLDPNVVEMADLPNYLRVATPQVPGRIKCLLFVYSLVKPE